MFFFIISSSPTTCKIKMKKIINNPHLQQNKKPCLLQMYSETRFRDKVPYFEKQLCYFLSRRDLSYRVPCEYTYRILLTTAKIKRPRAETGRP